MFTLQHFRILQHLSAQGSLTQAAARMHLTQSALSHQIRDLEASLGMVLLQRTGKKLCFTEAGRRILQSAQAVLAEVDGLHSDLHRLKATAAGRIRLSTECYTCYHWLSPILADFQRQHPDVAISLVPEAAAAPLTYLAQGRLDVAVVSESGPASPWVKTALFEGELVVVVATTHPWAQRQQPLVPADFASETLLLYNAKHPTSLQQKPFFAALRPHSLLEVPLTDAIIELVQARLGVTIMPYWTVEPFLNSKNLCLLPLPADARQYAWYACTAPSAAPIVTRLMELIQASRPSPLVRQ